MEILNVGLGEMVIVLIIALLVFGPERLPEMARQAARFLAQLRRMSDEVQRTIMEEAKPVTRPFEEAKREIESSTQSVKEARSDINRELKGIGSAATVRAQGKNGEGKRGAESQNGARTAISPPEPPPEKPVPQTGVSSTEPTPEPPSYKPVSRTEVTDGDA